MVIIKSWKTPNKRFLLLFAENTSDMQTSLQNIVQYFSDAAESFVKVQSSILGLLRYMGVQGISSCTSLCRVTLVE